MTSWTQRRLDGDLVALEPLEAQHAGELRAAAADGRIWAWMSVDGSRPEAFARWFSEALEAREAGAELPFATRDRATGALVGSTRFLALAPEHRRLEIGHTWVVPSQWGTGVNVESKLLLLADAFERLGCRRVEFKTDAANERSRAALAALPAVFEGIHRKHMLVQDGRSRDSAWYSVLDDEWPEVRRHLLRRLGRRARPPD